MGASRKARAICTMIAPINFRAERNQRSDWAEVCAEMHSLIAEVEKRNSEFDHAEFSGLISSGLNSYLKALNRMESTLDEINVLFDNGYQNKIPSTLDVTRFMRTCIRANFETGGIFSPHHQSLIDYAQERYNAIVQEGRKLISLGVRAA